MLVFWNLSTGLGIFGSGIQVTVWPILLRDVLEVLCRAGFT